MSMQDGDDCEEVMGLNESALDGIHSGIDHSRRTIPHLEQHAHATFIASCQASSAENRGFQSLPVDLQSSILTRACAQLDNRHRVAAVCRAFYAHATVLHLTQQHFHLRKGYVGPSTAAYMPCVRAVVSRPAAQTPFLLRVLGSAEHRTPHLTSLTIGVYSQHLRAAVAALQLNSQLTHLALHTFKPDVLPDPAEPAPVLPSLPKLRSLDLRLEPRTAGGPPPLLLNLETLESMTGLTSLHFKACEVDDSDPSHTHVAFAPVARALSCLTSLRMLSLVGWGSEAGAEAHSCWSTIGRALPSLHSLSTLRLEVNTRSSEAAQHVATVAAVLPSLCALREIEVFGRDWGMPEAMREQSAAEAATSQQLTAGLGALTQLTSVRLASLGHLATLQHCCRGLQPLVNLAQLRLEISWLGPRARPWDGDADAAPQGSAESPLSALLSRLTRLETLELGSSAMSEDSAETLVQSTPPRCLAALSTHRSAKVAQFAPVARDDVTHLHVLAGTDTGSGYPLSAGLASMCG